MRQPHNSQKIKFQDTSYKMGLAIQVQENSIAVQNGLENGDIINRINGNSINDQIDFSFHSSDEVLDIEIEKSDGSKYYVSIERVYNESLGISVIPPKITQCRNKCVFCFIHQQPRDKKMRRSLYVMDDDYRYSFSDGNFITLTNLKPHEWRRIYQLKLSPLYISVHTTNPELRRKMVQHKKAGEIMKQLKKLMDHDIHYHAQIVLCRGYNDNEHLDKTIQDLETLSPFMEGIAVVPSGLTRYRERLTDLEDWNKESALKTIKQVKKWQKLFREKHGKSIVYLSDEFYFLAGKNIPPSVHYDGFYYTEDGVGTTRYFYHIFNSHKKHLPEKLEKPRKVTIVCGLIAENYLKEAVDRLNEIENLEVNLVAIQNNFFGNTINVTGLITATDIVDQLKGKELGDKLIIPEVALRKEDHLFLDDYTVPEVEKELKCKIHISKMGAGYFIDACLGI